MMFRGEKSHSAVLLVFMLLFVLPAISYATPVLSGVSAAPGDAWLGQNVIISASCTDGENLSISRVYASVEGPSIILPPLDFVALENGTYALSLSDSDRYGRTGTFIAAVFCVSENGTEANQNVTFKVSNFSASISSVFPSPAYVGDVVEINFFAKKDAAPLPYGVGFNVSIDGEYVSLLQPPAYDLSRGWILRFAAPDNPGTYSLEVEASYGGTSATASSEITVKSVFEFRLSAIDKSEVLPGDNITATLFASRKGTAIALDKSMLSAKMGASSADILDVFKSASEYKAKIAAPTLSPGRYDLKISLAYGNFTGDVSSQVAYVIPAGGKLADPSGAAVSATISFVSSTGERAANTNAEGKYSVNILPGTYDIKVVHDRATLTLFGVSVSEFNDPVHFYMSDGQAPGIRSAGLFVYESAISGGTSKISMKYDESKISREEGLAVFRCTNWNGLKKECLSPWDKITSSIDTVRNIAEVSLQNPTGAYLVGTTDSLSLDFSLDRTTKYFVGETIKVSGITQNPDRVPVGSVEVTARISGQATSKSVASSAEGIFSLEIPVPPAEGNYTLSFTAKRDPYAGYNTTKGIEVIRSRELSILVPDTVRVGPGKNSSVEISVMNTGQAPLSGAKISLSGIPDGYFRLWPDTLSVDPGAEKKFVIIFSIPDSAPKTTYGADLAIPFEDKQIKKTFALTITDGAAQSAAVSASESVNATSGESPLAGFALPTGLMTAALGYGYDILYLAILSIASVSAAIFFRRRRASKDAAGAVGFSTEVFKRRTYLLEIKKAVEKGFERQLKSMRLRTSLKKSARKKGSHGGWRA